MRHDIGVVGIFNAHRLIIKKDLQVHGYCCSFHPKVLIIVSRGKCVKQL
jgi:hypothetical protein